MLYEFQEFFLKMEKKKFIINILLCEINAALRKQRFRAFRKNNFAFKSVPLAMTDENTF